MKLLTHVEYILGLIDCLKTFWSNTISYIHPQRVDVYSSFQKNKHSHLFNLANSSCCLMAFSCNLWRMVSSWLLYRCWCPGLEVALPAGLCRNVPLANSCEQWMWSKMSSCTQFWRSNFRINRKIKRRMTMFSCGILNIFITLSSYLYNSIHMGSKERGHYNQNQLWLCSRNSGIARTLLLHGQNKKFPSFSHLSLFFPQFL